MCGRFTQTQSSDAIALHFDLSEACLVEPRYNIAPSQPIAIVRQPPDSPERECQFLQWGLIPSWSKDPTIGRRLINARAETVAEKPSFRAALKRRRCLIVADGFYEWQRPPTAQKKQPYYIHLRDHQLFGFAGLWEIWQSINGSVIETCTIITTEANDLMQPLHDRMPVIVSPQDYEDWLDPTLQEGRQVQPMLRPYPATEMAAYPVSTLVNSPRADIPACLAPSKLSC